MRVGNSPNAMTANAIVNSAWLCTITLARPTGTPCAMPKACARNWPRNSVALMAISSGHDTSGLRTNRHGTAAMAKRSVVISVGGNSSSASRAATKASPQITATRIARKMSAGFMAMRKIGACSSPIKLSRSDLLHFDHEVCGSGLSEVKKALLAFDPTDLVDKDRPLGLQAIGQIDVGRPIPEPPCDWTYDRTARRFMVASRCQDERRPTARLFCAPGIIQFDPRNITRVRKRHFASHGDCALAGFFLAELAASKSRPANTSSSMISDTAVRAPLDCFGRMIGTEPFHFSDHLIQKSAETSFWGS